MYKYCIISIVQFNLLNLSDPITCNQELTISFGEKLISDSESILLYYL